MRYAACLVCMLALSLVAANRPQRITTQRFKSGQAWHSYSNVRSGNGRVTRYSVRVLPGHGRTTQSYIRVYGGRRR